VSSKRHRSQLLTAVVMAAIAVAGCDLNAQHMANGGPIAPGASPKPTPTHIIQPPDATTDNGNSVVFTIPNGPPVAAGAEQLTVSGSPTALTLTFQDPGIGDEQNLQALQQSGRRYAVTFHIKMPTKAQADNYTYNLNDALVTQVSSGYIGTAPYGVRTVQVTLAASSWSWDYQPVDSNGNPTGSAEHSAS
jgi:hypothetical protein